MPFEALSVCDGGEALEGKAALGLIAHLDRFVIQSTNDSIQPPPFLDSEALLQTKDKGRA
jgi:hypothetical protein